MAHVVGAISMSHAPGASGWPDAPPMEQKNKLDHYHIRVAEYLDKARPDVVIAFLDDHFENLFRTLMPTFSIGIAAEHSGPAEFMAKALGYEGKMAVPSDPKLAEHLLGALIHKGFDVARQKEIEYGNNLMTPFKLIRPQLDLKIVPVFTNVFTPPLTTMKRAYSLGNAIREVVDNYPENMRVLFLATGGLSHWPPFWKTNSPKEDAFLQRMRRYQTEGKSVLLEDPHIFTDLAEYEIEMANKTLADPDSKHPLVNDAWDRRIMAAFEAADSDFLMSLTYKDIVQNGGHGANEILNWMEVMGAMNGQKAEIIGYEPVIEWICGMGYLVY